MNHPRAALLPKGRDPLTGLWSQDYFCARLDRLLARPAERLPAVTLALTQLGNFYEIRQWVGKSEADQLLRDIAQALRRILPADTPLCRCRNHEFALLLLGESSHRAARVAEKIRQDARVLAGHSIPPQLSLNCMVGLATVDALSLDTAVLFARARHNLLQRETQRLRSQPGDPVSTQSAEGTLGLLRNAIPARALEISYQAVVALDDPGIAHYELRLGLRHPNRLIPAAEFMDLAVQYALGETLDRWMLEQALGILRTGPGKHWRLTVNLSQNSLVSPDFLQWLAARLTGEHGIAGRLVLQVSEIDLLIAQHHMPEFSNALQSLNLALCISHFGCTPNPLRYLSLLRAQAVKLDGALLEQLETEAAGRQRLASLVTELRRGNLAVMAPQQENLRVAPWLWQAGVRQFQGNAIHAPAKAGNYRFIPPINVE